MLFYKEGMESTTINAKTTEEITKELNETHKLFWKLEGKQFFYSEDKIYLRIDNKYSYMPDIQGEWMEEYGFELESISSSQDGSEYFMARFGRSK